MQSNDPNQLGWAEDYLAAGERLGKEAAGRALAAPDLPLAIREYVARLGDTRVHGFDCSASQIRHSAATPQSAMVHSHHPQKQGNTMTHTFGSDEPNSSEHHRRRGRRGGAFKTALGLLCVFALVATACGDDDDGGQAAQQQVNQPTSEDTDQSSAAEDPEPAKEDAAAEPAVEPAEDSETAEDRSADPVPGSATRKLADPVIDETLTIPYQTVNVLDSEMTFLEAGSGSAVLFIHGNPTSAYLWRNVVPFVAEDYRAIAVDLIGMGRSGKPDIDYTFADHYRYLEAFIDELGLDDLTLVGHDWGAALAWEYARLNPEKVTRLAFMEGLLPPGYPTPTFESLGDQIGPLFRALKDEAKGEVLVLENNMFVEQVLPGFVDRELGPEALAAYGAPYLEPADRKPTLAWPREVPIEGEPVSNVELMANIETFMGTTNMPVLLAYVEPGVLIPPDATSWFIERIANLETAFVGQGFHFIQEDQPDAIGRALQDWMRRN